LQGLEKEKLNNIFRPGSPKSSCESFAARSVPSTRHDKSANRFGMIRQPARLSAGSLNDPNVAGIREGDVCLIDCKSTEDFRSRRLAQTNSTGTTEQQ